MNTVWMLLLMMLNCLPSRDKNNLIDWDPSRRLVWEDFQASADDRSANAALTSTTLKFSYSYREGKLTCHILCQFDKSRSWGRVRNPYILSHEQGHFDIAEINARKFNQSLKQYRIGELSSLPGDLNGMYEKAMNQLKQQQESYDRETRNSLDTAGQEKWLRKISDQLRELEAFAGYH